MLDQAEILHFKFIAELLLDACNFLAIFPGNEQIIHPDYDPDLPFLIDI